MSSDVSTALVAPAAHGLASKVPSSPASGAAAAALSAALSAATPARSSSAPAVGEPRGTTGEVDSFGFPHKPYPLQQAMMERVYHVLEHGGVGILESPTGTGKTLALLCPALAWMRRRERALLAEAVAPCDDAETCEDWAREHRRSVAWTIADVRWRRRENQREARRLRLSRAGALTEKGTVHREKVRRLGPPGGHAAPNLSGEAEFSLEVAPPLPMPEEPPDEAAQAAEEAFENKLQVVFCSRTHSQLSQVLREIQRIPKEPTAADLSVVTLGARTNLCVNDSVRARARGAAHLNDLCRIATDRAQAPGGCTLKKQAQAMADAVLTSMLDIEAMVQRGRAPVGGGCPYYGTRQAVREADVLLVPYTSLVNADMRRKLNIRTDGNVLIFDEAHNLLEAISDANSVTITAPQAKSAVDDLGAYCARYEARLSPGNAMRLRQLRQFCVLLHRHLGGLEKSSAHTVGAFLVALGADHFDLPELSRFLEATELPRKVRGFAEAMRPGGPAAAAGNTAASVYGVSELLAALQGSTGNDRILCQVPTAEGEVASVRYLSLDAEARFRELLVSARAVIFAGGTLEPRTEFAPLYAGLKGAGADAQARVVNFAGRHVVPSAQIFARYVTKGPSGLELDFRKDKRSSTAQLADLKAIVSLAAAVTPGGAIFFLPSFEYLAAAAAAVGSRIGQRAVFVETRGASSAGCAGCLLEDESKGGGGESTFRAFAAAVRKDGGAVLLAVSGAKLSEGIDFKDDLCRLVAVVGLPYPNASDLGLIEKMRFLDACRAKGSPGLTGREFYTARCMKGVNQCVGRSIRHAGDWAAVLLLDHRYALSGINGSVSLWLREQAREATFADAERELRAFFSARRKAGP